MKDWKFIAAVAALTIIAVVRVASTHRVLSGTSDEPVHVFCSYEWWHGKYFTDPQHPPLARILAGIGIRHLPPPKLTDATTGGNELLYHGNRYRKNLARARIGILVLLIVACVSVAAWARRRYSRGIAILATAIFTSMPPVLAHAGVVTTDLAVAATIPLALLALDMFVGTPASRRLSGERLAPEGRRDAARSAAGTAAFLGFAIGLGLISKYSFLVFFPPSALIVMAMRWPLRIRARDAAIAIVTAFVVFWGGYKFDFGSPADAIDKGHFWVEYSVEEGPLRPVMKKLAWMPMPSPVYLIGLGVLKIHDRDGHFAYLLGQHSMHGWWYFFPVVFFYKTPIPILILSACGIVFLIHARTRAGAEFALVPLAILLVGMTSSINIGVRHVLPMYAPLAILSAYGAATLWQRTRTRFEKACFLALLVWLFGGVAAAHPDYLPWFNEAAGSDPSRITVDSNLDWGQDIFRLERATKELGITVLPMKIATTMILEMHGIRPVQMEPHTKYYGYVAVSESYLRWGDHTGEYDWLKIYKPVRRIGKSIRLYYIPPP